MLKRSIHFYFLILMITLSFNSSAAPKRQYFWSKEFDFFITYLENFYRPLEYKIQEHKIKFNDLVSEYKKSFNDLEIDHSDQKTKNAHAVALYYQFIANFKDIHLRVNHTDLEDKYSHKVIFLEAEHYDGHYYIGYVSPRYKGQYNIVEGDEILAIDDKDIKEIRENILMKYISTGSDELNEKIYCDYFFYRPFYLEDFKPNSSTIKIKIKRNDQGKSHEYTVNIPWIDSKDIPKNNNKSQKEIPYFLNENNQKEFKIKPFKIDPNDLKEALNDLDSDLLNKCGEQEDEIFDTCYRNIFAALYKFDKKVILLIRQPSYSLENNNKFSSNEEIKIVMSNYIAIMKKHEDFVDVLVIDQTRNSGGRTQYMTEFTKLFGKNDYLDNLVFSFSLTSENKNTRNDNSLASLYKTKIDEAKRKNELYTDFFPIYDCNQLLVSLPYTWEKPVLLLIDGRSISSADMFPLLMKKNNLATLFGTQTAGAGGSVVDLPKDFFIYTELSVSMTDSLVSLYNEGDLYDNSELLENNGVRPDIERVITYEDRFETSYKKYIKDFSNAAISLEYK